MSKKFLGIISFVRPHTTNIWNKKVCFEGKGMYTTGKV